MSSLVSDNYLLVEDPVTVNYLRKTDEGEFADAVAVPYAKRREVTKEDILSDAMLNQLSAVWHLWKANMPTVDSAKVIPKVGDKISATTGTPTGTWIIRSIRVSSFGERFRCVCVREK